MLNNKTDDPRYPHWQLTDQIIGLVFESYNGLGFGYQERFYQRALANKLQDADLSFKKEDFGLVLLDKRPVGRYYVDFIVEDKVVIELKVANEFFDSHMQQILSYLEAKKLKVGLLCLITKRGIKIKRIIR